MNWIDIKDTSGLPLPSGEWKARNYSCLGDPPEFCWQSKSKNFCLVCLKDGSVAFTLVSYSIYEDGLELFYFDEVDHERDDTGNSFTDDEVLKYMPIEP